MIKGRNIIVLVLFLFIGVLALSGCGNDKAKLEDASIKEPKSKIIDCGLDQGCFAKNFRSCTPAKIGGGSMVIKGGTPDACEIYIYSPETKFDGKVIQEEMSMTCITNPSSPTTQYEAVELGGFLMLELMDKADCKGTLFDTLNEIYTETLDNLKSTSDKK